MRRNNLGCNQPTNQHENTVVRNSNMELLRIVAMLMIIVYHIVVHCIFYEIGNGSASIVRTSDLFKYPDFSEKITFLNMIMPFGQISNNIFLLISGYFVINRKKSVDLAKTGTNLLLQLGYSAITLTVVSTILYFLNQGRFYFRFLQIYQFNNYFAWFVGYYFIVMVIGALFLNKYLTNLDQKGYMTFLIVMFALNQFQWSGDVLDNLARGLRTAAIGVTMYSLGGYISKYEPFKKVRISTIFIILAIVGALLYISLFNITQNSLNDYYRYKQPIFNQTVYYNDNYAIFVVVSATCMFELFSRISIPNSKVINFLGKSTFMVYLIHDNELFYSIWGTIDWVTKLAENFPLFIVYLFVITLATFAVGVAAYIAYLGVLKLFERYKWLFAKT